MPKLSALMLSLLRPYLLRAVDDGDDDADGEQGGEEELGAGDPDEQDADADTEAEDGADEGDPDEDGDGDSDGDGEEEADGELIVTLGEEPAPKDERAAPAWLRELRKSNRDKDRTIRELEAKIRAGTQPEPQIVVGEEPDIDTYETWTEEGKAKFKKDWADWNSKKQAFEQSKRDKEAAEAKNREAWQRTQEAYNAAKGALKVEHFEDAEETVKASFNETQQGILLVAMEPKKAALLVYALGSSPKKLKEVSAITDPIKFTVAITKLESEMKVSRTKTAPAPERKISGNVAGAAAVDSQIERLRNEARKTGDYSKVVEHNRRIAEKARVKQKA